jgi:proline iminopeptidase
VYPLFPEIKPYTDYRLAVDNTHSLYVEECGDPQGIPVLFIHGGPGAGCESYHRRFFDPDVYRIILFDQRGCGRSTPHACVENNTTQDLVSDMEKLRERLKLDKWALFGGSWGSTLALAYAQTHPDKVSGMILRGIFLCRPQEIKWFYQDGASRIFPDHWQAFIAPIPENERDNLLKAHHKRLMGDDDIARMASAKAWSVWEGRASTLRPKQDVIAFFASPHTALSLATIEAHYFINDSFLKPNQLIKNADRLKDIPATIVHGRYDMVCPIVSAWELHRAWENSVLQIIPEAGHSATEPGIIDALVKASFELAVMLGGNKT